jgi:tetratricopeptide (TPR) repeat protein
MKSLKILLLIISLLFLPEFSSAQSATATFAKATSLFLDSRYKEAITIYKNFIDLFPQHDQVVNAYYNIGECYYRLMNFAMAEKYFKKVIINFPKSIIAIEARNRLGDSYQKQELFSKAISEYQKVIKEHPHTLYADYAQYAINWLTGVEMSKVAKAKKALKLEEKKKEKIKKSIKPKKRKKVLKKIKKIKEKRIKEYEKITISIINNIQNQNILNYLEETFQKSKKFKVIPKPIEKPSEEIIEVSKTRDYFFNLKNRKKPPLIEEYPKESQITLLAKDKSFDYLIIQLDAIFNQNQKVLLSKEIRGNKEEIKKKILDFVNELERSVVKKR